MYFEDILLWRCYCYISNNCTHNPKVREATNYAPLIKRKESNQEYSRQRRAKEKAAREAQKQQQTGTQTKKTA